MAANKTSEQPPQQPEHKLPLPLERSWSTIVSEPTMPWHRLPGLHLHPHTSLALGGLAGAIGATAAVAPILTVIDLSIVRAQVEPKLGGLFGALRHTVQDLRAGRLAFARPLGLLTVVYFGTYIVANETHVTATNMGVDYKVPTALAAATFNIAAIQWKVSGLSSFDLKFALSRRVDRSTDREVACTQPPAPIPLPINTHQSTHQDRHFYRLFGLAKRFPVQSFALFALRDGLTITSSFVFRDMLMERMEAQGVAHRTADLAASLTVPLAAQLVSTPLHIWAMDLPSRPTASAWSRLAAVAAGYSSVLTGRAMRILPAFSIGTYINDVVKESFWEYNGVPYEK